MHGYSTVALFAILTTVSLLSVACGNSGSSLIAPTPTPTAIRAKALYDALLSEKERNPTRLEARVEQKQTLRVTIKITKIEGRRIQEHLDAGLDKLDDYIECEFNNERLVIPLNVGQSVDVYGRLHEAFKNKFLFIPGDALKFRSCYY